MSLLLDNLNKYRKDKGIMAAARSLKTNNPNGLRLVVELGGSLSMLEDRFIVQAFGIFPESSNKELPTVASELKHTIGLETTFMKLISKTTKERACHLLLPLISRLSSENKPFDWEKLYEDIKSWERTSPINTQHNWAQKFWKI